MCLTCQVDGSYYSRREALTNRDVIVTFERYKALVCLEEIFYLSIDFVDNRTKDKS